MSCARGANYWSNPSDIERDVNLIDPPMQAWHASYATDARSVNERDNASKEGDEDVGGGSSTIHDAQVGPMGDHFAFYGVQAETVQEIVRASRASPSWRAWAVESTDFTGTTEENIQLYAQHVEFEEDG